MLMGRQIVAWLWRETRRMSVGKHFSSLKTSRFLLFMHALPAPNFDCNDQCLKGVVVVCDSDSMFVMWLFCEERERDDVVQGKNWISTTSGNFFFWQEAYEAECEASSASSSDHEAACQHLDRFENLVRQSGQFQFCKFVNGAWPCQGRINHYWKHFFLSTIGLLISQQFFQVHLDMDADF